MVIEQQPPQNFVSLSLIDREEPPVGTRQEMENGTALRELTPVL
jgi:hypothetical protein